MTLNNPRIWKILAIIAVLGIGLILSRSKSTPAPETKPVMEVSAAEAHQLCEAKPQAPEKFDCYAQVFKDYMTAQGGRKTLQLLADLEKLGGYAQVNCHPLSHKVGNIALHVYGSVVAASPEYLPVCASGFYHGLLEEYLATAKDYNTGIIEVCGTPDGQKYTDWFQCVHGEGHGIMQYRDNEVPISLKDCDLLDPGHQAREICYAGVFMENITTDEKTGHQAKYVNPKDPIYPCNIVELQYKNACYFLSSSLILKLNGWNYEQAFRTCDKKAEKEYLKLCYQSMGRDVSGGTLRNQTRVNELCMLGAASLRGECFFGAVRDFINDKGEFGTAITLCNSVTTAYQESCFNGIFTDLPLYQHGQQFLDTCATMPEPYQTQCKARA